MTIKRMLLLLSAMAAFAAFVAPAQANVFWTSDGNTEQGTTLPNEEEPTVIQGRGPITSTSESGLVSGACNTSGSGMVWNGSETEMGEGQVTDFNITTPCATNVPSCTLVNATASAEPENAWPVTLTTTDTVDIYNVTFTNTYEGAGCALAGVPHQVSATGTVTGTLENINTRIDEQQPFYMAVRVNLNNHVDDMEVEVGGKHVGVGVDLQGSFIIERPEQLDLTFEHKEEEG